MKLFPFLLIFYVQIVQNIKADNLNDLFLTHYWPIKCGTMLDEIDGANMTQGQGSSTKFVADRFGNENEALNLNGSWTQVPSGFYFNTPQFSITTWIYPRQLGSWSRLIDFGNGPNQDNVVFAIGSPNNRPAVQICPPSACSIELYSSQAFTLNTWQFLAMTYDGAKLTIYIDSIQTSKFQAYMMPNKKRTSNLIGKSNMGNGDGVSWSHIDDLRFYNTSLNSSQLVYIRNLNISKHFKLYLKFEMVST
jgi:hypothetical protein